MSRYVIENCYYIGSIVCTNISDSSEVGGIVGRWATVSGCYFNGEINCNNGDVGGIIGQGYCTDCYAKGSVIGRLSIRRNCWI